MNEETEIKMIQDLFEKMGSEQGQAARMAQQLVKRATQVSKERGVERIEAMKYLIELVTKGRSGVAEDTFLGESSSDSNQD